MHRHFWPLWLTGNLVWLFGVPALYAAWLWHEVQHEYAIGIRTTTDGDSIAIPVAGFALTNFGLLFVLNLCWGIYALIRRWRSH